MATRQVDIALRMTTDVSDAAADFDKVGDAALRMGDDVDRATRTADDASSRMDSAAESADNMASRSAQAAGGLGDLGGALAQMPGPLGAMGAGMELAAPSIMGVTGAADLMNLAMTSSIVTTTKAKAAAAAHAVTSGVQAAATRTVTIAQRALNLAMRANPIGLIITAVALLVAGFVLLYKRSETFRKIVHKVGEVGRRAVGWIWDKLKDLWRWIGSNWKNILAILTGPIGIAVRLITAHWDKIKDRMVDLVVAIRDRFVALKDRLAGVAGTIKDKLVNVFEAPRRVVNWLIEKINWIVDKLSNIDLPDLPSWLPGVGKSSATTSSARFADPAAPSTTTVNINLYGVAASGDEVVRQLSAAFARAGMQLGTVTV